ncbi:putative quinol monooxygenase [Mucilaginibacter sp. HD30]
MIIEYIRYSIPVELQQAFMESYTKAADSLRSSANCLGYELTQGNEEPENYMLRIKWDSMEGHLNGFRRSEGFKSFFKEVAPYFNNIQEMKHYELTEIYWRR